jgi:hypothetical protein
MSDAPAPIPPVPPPPTATDVDNYRTSLIDLLNLLWDALRRPSSDDAGDRIMDLAENVSDILTKLNQAALNANTAQYTALKPSVDAVNAQLTSAQKQINDWVQVASVASQIASAIGQAINLAAKVI